MAQKILLVYPEPYFLNFKGGIATYLRFAVEAHLSAGRDVHVLTWFTDPGRLPLDDESLFPLIRSQVSLVHIDHKFAAAKSRGGVYPKTISDLLLPHIIKLIENFQPDVIEGTDYQFPLHSYLEKRRSGSIDHNIPIITFNHGMLRQIDPAAGKISTLTDLRIFACEQQVLSWADKVFAPSRWAAVKVERMLKSKQNILMVPEPYKADKADSWRVRDNFNGHNFAYFGRLSFAKGLDRSANFLSGIVKDWPICDILFVGREVDFPFRQAGARNFIETRLGERLKSKARFVSEVNHDELKDLLHDSDFFLNMSRTETFSYTTVEAIQTGMIPIVFSDSAMAELLPHELRQSITLGPAPVNYSDSIEKLESCVRNYRTWIKEIQDHVRGLTDLSRFAACFDDFQSWARGTAPKAHYSGLDVSVLIPTHNDARVLPRALSSLFKQTEPVLEILVLDDGTSSDEDRMWLDRIRKCQPVRVLETANRGLAEARRLLLSEARGDLVMFLDADDYLDPSYVTKALSALNGNRQFAAAFARRQNFGESDDEYSCCLLGTPWHWILNDLRMTAIIERRVFEKVPFNKEMLNGEADDWWWWLRFSLHGFEAVMVPEPLFHYCVRKGTMSYPWTEGQAALTVSLIQDLIAEASALGVDLTEPLQVTWGQQYKVVNMQRRD